MSVANRVPTWFGVDDPFVRPASGIERSDWLVATAMFVFAAVNRELARPVALYPVGAPVWVEYLVLLTAAAGLVARRRWPVLVAAYAFGHFFVSCVWVPEVGFTLGYQAITFFAIYSAAAWARDRGLALLVVSAIGLAMFGWLAWDFAVGSGLDSLRTGLIEMPPQEPSLLPPITSIVLQNYLMNAVYVGGAVWLGRNAWWRARATHQLQQQAEQLATQSTELQRQAVIDERLRIARELHDVVAHHVSVIGIQAGAARILLGHRPEAAAEALSIVEESSRSAVSEMRGLLGALRGAAGETTEHASRAPEPTLAELPALFAEFEPAGLQIDLTEQLEAPGGLHAIALPLQLSMYRIIQEALNNVRRHSTAKNVRVTVRSAPTSKNTPGWVEVEILDDGRPLPGTSGSGLGQLGMRERVRSHGGTAEIGPRVTGGYRVRVRLPLQRLRDEVHHG